MPRTRNPSPPSPGEEAHLFGDGATPYRVLAITTTGCFAVRVAGDGRPRVFHWYFRSAGKEPVTIDPCPALIVWSCRSPWDPRPAGRLTRLHADSSGLTALDVRSLPGLAHLRCGHNHLARLDCSGLMHLRTLDCSGNDLAYLDVTGCHALQRLRTGGNPGLRRTVTEYLAQAQGLDRSSGGGRRRPTSTSLFDL